MTKRWIMDARSRRAKHYIEKHAQLERECRKPEPSKRDRKRAASELFRQCGAP